MTTIDLRDEVFATVTQWGNEVVSVKITGISSYNEVLRYLRSLGIKYRGVVTLKLRNLTKGWQQVSRLMMLEHQENSQEAVQLSLF